MYNFLFYIIVGFYFIKFISFIYRYFSIDNIIKHTYIYNLSFEDGSVDRNIMNFNSNDVLLCITTGGDNILNYLIDGVKKIHTADINKHQNFLLETKIGMMKVLSRDDFFKVLNSRNKNSEGYKLFLDNLEQIKENMSPPGKIWLDENKTEFSHFIESGSVKYTAKILNFIFWYYGSSGIFQCNSIQEQIQFYHKNELEKKIKKIINFFCNSVILFFCKTLVGVPIKQLELIGNVNDFFVDMFKYVIFNTELKKNYFFYPYCNGSFSEECCPDYLKEKNYLKVRDRLDRITIHTDFIGNVCKKVAEKGDVITKAILLDHMDWLEEGQIMKEWELYKKYCDKDCIYLWRSASKKKYIGCLNELDYIEHYVLDHKKETFIKGEDKFFDRIGTYYSTYMAKIPPNNIMMNSINTVYNITLKDKLYIFYEMMSAPYKQNKNINNHEDKLNQFYKSQAALYDAYRQNMLHGKKKLIPSIPFNNNDTLLILAGGTGDILDHMPYANKFKKIVLVDLCGELLKIAKEKRGNIQNLNIVHHDATTFISEEKFDKIIITYSLTMIPCWTTAIDIIKKNLKYEGYLGVSDFTVPSDSNIFEKINGNLYKNIFKKDGVFLNENHIKVLDTTFERVNCYIEYGGFPLTPSLFKCPYYYGLWKNTKNINKYD
jgi:S-adenosylmethionine:diacylglycerol 3-amino-3-carboxypropyl transferase/ubiquinone/menaquinone biosynthesis C-methylase UbiE